MTIFLISVIRDCNFYGKSGKQRNHRIICKCSSGENLWLLASSFLSKHVKIKSNMSSVLIHKYTFQQSFSLEESVLLAEPECFFFHLFCSPVLVGPEWTGNFPKLKLNVILQDLSSWKFCECVCNYCDRTSM